MNVDLFKTWSSDMAWLLGYIWADGCLSIDKDNGSYKLLFKCTIKDRELVDRVYLLLDCHQTIRLIEPCCFMGTKGKKYWSKACVSLQLGSKVMIQDLLEFGLCPAKSSKNILFPVVPDQYLPHFIRGYFDGDGSVAYVKPERGRRGYVRVWFGGSKKFIEELRNQVVNCLGVRKVAVLQMQSIYLVQWAAKSDVGQLYNWLYPIDNVPCLLRKRLKMKKAFN